MTGRPTFNYENDLNKPIRAGGIILFKRVNNEFQILLIKKIIGGEARYEDIGGKTEFIDLDEVDTVAREVKEETNDMINEKIIKKQIINSKSSYNFKSKYILYFIKANKYEKKLNSDNFGILENHDIIERTIHWVSLRLILENQINIHPRLYLMINDIKNFFVDLII